MDTLHVATLNVSGLRNDKKRKSVFTWLRSLGYDVIFLQETHCHLRRDEKRWSLEWDGQSIWSKGTNKSRGVAVLFNRNNIYNFQNVAIDSCGRYISFDLYIGDSKYRMVNVYSPNCGNERTAFFNNIQSFLVDDYENILAGDFNCVLNTIIDRQNCVEGTEIGQSNLKNLMNCFDLEDVWRRRYPDVKDFSWCRGNKSSRIDYWLLSRSLDNQVDHVCYKPTIFSDHRCVELKFRVSETKCGIGLWKMNVEVIKSQAFHKAFTNWWEIWRSKQAEYKNIGIWWEIGKKKIKELCISIARLLNKEKKDKMCVTEKRIKELENMKDKMHENNLELENLRNELKKVHEKAGEGAKIRSRIKWYEEGEMSSKYFYGLEKRNAKDKAWEKILDSNGQLQFGTNNIIETQVKYYTELYSSEEIDNAAARKYLRVLDQKVCKEDEKYLDKKIDPSEMLKALKKMKNNKSPGPDGLAIEFYKLYWKNVGQDLLQVFEDSFKSEELPYSFYSAVIRLIFKKGQREDIRNWRPVSLLNSDVKILSKILAERLKTVLHKIIHPDQTGCIPNRFIGANIRLLQDVIESCENDEVILLLDQQKAFDRVEHKWLFDVLSEFGIKGKFQKWLKILYKQMKSAILTNGYVSRYFPVQRGIRQGDSLSALLYIIQCEPLNAMIRNDQTIKGISIVGHSETTEIKSKQYVDDTFICLRNRRDIETCLNKIDEFGYASGSKLNKDKTVALFMKEPTDQEQNQLKFTTGPEKVLGITVGKGSSQIWQSLLERVKKKLDRWKGRNLSLAGKVHLVRSLGMSTVMYVSNMKVVEQSQIEKFERIFYDFVWGGKKALVRREICVLPKKLGGIGMIDMKTAIKVQRIKWIIRMLMSSEKEEWNIIPLKAIKCLDTKFGIDYFTLRVNDSKKALSNIQIPTFYKECIEFYQELCRKGRVKSDEDIIWCNKLLRFNGEALMFPHWAKSGILYKCDIIKNGQIDEWGIYEKLIWKASYFFEIAILKSCVPKEWLGEKQEKVEKERKECVKESILNERFEVPGGLVKTLRKLSTCDIYNILLLNTVAKIKSKQYWIEKNQFWDKIGFGKKTEIDFEAWFNNNFNNRLNPRKCNDFNWKIFHGVVMTEKRLSKMNLSDGICLLCSDKPENIEHLLFECISLGNIWYKIEKLLETIINKTFEVNQKFVLIGELEKSTENDFINMMLSIIRFTIWKRRNCWKFEKSYMPDTLCYNWIVNEINSHCEMLKKTKLTKKNNELNTLLESAIRTTALPSFG